MGEVQGAGEQRIGWAPFFNHMGAANAGGDRFREEAFTGPLWKAQNGGFNGGAKPMSDTDSEFRKVFLIYCLDLMPDGRYVALNRRYKPVGHTGTEWVDYEAMAVGFKFKRTLSKAQIAALSWNGDTAAERIYLYNDGSIPTDSAANWAAYSARLERLAGYKISH
jgi:hypothetical protein